MTAAVKFDNFINDLVNGTHKNGVNTGSPSDNWKIYLTNATPNVATHTVKADLAEIAVTGGYPGAQSIGLQRSQSGGIITLSGSSVVVTCDSSSPQGIGPFRYPVLFNDTPSSPLDPLIAYWDYGVPLSLTPTQTFTVEIAGTIGTVQ
jgi:hypothetical protein